jgi:hypothetical protein
MESGSLAKSNLNLYAAIVSAPESACHVGGKRTRSESVVNIYTTLSESARGSKSNCEVNLHLQTKQTKAILI